jgi:hypothetical protein
MGWHNTGCYAVYNETDDILLIENGAGVNPTLEVPPRQPRTYSGFVIPWCANSLEIASKAFRFRIGPADPATTVRPGRFFLFQDYNNSVVSWTPWNSAQPRYDDREQGGAGVSPRVDVVVREVSPGSQDFRPRVVRLE